MSTFSAQWLALREPLDSASRPASLQAIVSGSLGSRPQGSRLCVIDLGAGTGANLRHAAPRLGGSQDWLLVETDPLLMAAAAARLRSWARRRGATVQGRDGELAIQAQHFDCSIRGVCLNLGTQLQELALPNDALLTASALLDLVSPSWLSQLARRAAAAAVTVWFALTYDGRIECDPAAPEDEEVRELFNAHQRGDKGFGAALGPGAASEVGKVFAQHGYSMQCARSDWSIGPHRRALQHALVQGWAQAACEMAPRRAPLLGEWLKRRHQYIDEGRSALQVGNVDVVGQPGRADGHLIRPDPAELQAVLAGGATRD